tara:strand:- start:375 stop:869 length:495 start_codon:yes stop_codon:yes gene_type:complete
MINRRNKIMLGIALVAILLLIWSVAQASPFVFNFNSPSFSGIGQSSHYLTIENLEKSRRDAIIAKAEAEERRLENELKNTAIEIFRKNLETLFYSTLATQIIDNVFGTKDDQQNDGETVIDGYKVVWSSTDDEDDTAGVKVKITDAAGNVIYSYGFPYKETENE